MSNDFIERTIEKMRKTMPSDDLADEKARLAWSYMPESRLVEEILEEYKRRSTNGKRAKPEAGRV